MPKWLLIALVLQPPLAPRRPTTLSRSSRQRARLSCGRGLGELWRDTLNTQFNDLEPALASA